MTKCKLGDCAAVLISGVDKKTNPSEIPVRLCNYTDVYYNWAVTSEMHDGLMCASATQNEIDKFKIKKGQVALTKDSETREDIGIPSYMSCDFDDVILGYHCALITPDETNLSGKYLGALLNTEYVKRFFANNAGGSGQRYYLSDTNIKDLPLFLPDITTQRKIGKFLSSIDRLIQLSRKRIVELEKMAKEIYDYWFVQFDFPDKNGKPYKSSGGKMVYNPQLKRKIPEGWEVKRLDEICNVFNGATPSTKDDDNYGGNIAWITPKDLSDQNAKFVFRGERLITQTGYDSCSTHLLPAWSVLMSSRAPIGLMAIAANDVCTNQGFKSFVFDDVDDSLYAYYYLNDHMTEIEMLGSGTTFKEVSRGAISEYLVSYVADRMLYRKWVSIEKPIFEAQKRAQLQIEHLTSLREFLLPLLMNGQAKMGGAA